MGIPFGCAQEWQQMPAMPAASLDHDDFGSNRSEIMNVIDSNI
jgi:hypothetical protein